MTEKVLITAALPYVNGPLHFGHIAGAYLPADCYSRFQTFFGNEVLFICGSDEYGAAITLNAEKMGKTPKEHADFFHKLAETFFDQLNIRFSHYSRTSNKEHTKTVQGFFNDLMENGYIEAKTTDQSYSEEDKRFLADRYVQGVCPRCKYENARGDECPSCGASYETKDLINPTSKLTGASLSFKPTKHWFLCLDKLKDKLKHWIKQKDWKAQVLRMAMHYIDEAHPRSITRDLEWGVPVPLEEASSKVFYVWFDAPIGYISASKEWSKLMGQEDLWKKYWLDPETKLVQFIGKDNTPFHAVFFPAMILGQNENYKLVDELPANEFLNLEGKQFSKSDNWTIDTDAFFEKFTSDQIRYYIASNAPETSDSEFHWKDFQLKCNSDLLGKLGNLVNRTLVFIHKYLNGKIDKPKHIPLEDQDYLDQIHAKAKEIEKCYFSFHLRKASSLIMELAQLGNVYFDEKKPWIKVKEKDNKDLSVTFTILLEFLKALAVVSHPIIPNTSQNMWELLGNTDNLEDELWKSRLNDKLKNVINMPEPKVLFKKIEDDEIKSELDTLKAALNTQTNGSPTEEIEAIKEEIEFDHFLKLDLRVAKVLNAEVIEKSKKLLKLNLDIGLEKRTVVAGIRSFYDVEDLVGKKVIFLANLKPKKIMGILSHGMVMAAKDTKGLELPSIENLSIGSTVS